MKATPPQSRSPTLYRRKIFLSSPEQPELPPPFTSTPDKKKVNEKQALRAYFAFPSISLPSLRGLLLNLLQLAARTALFAFYGPAALSRGNDRRRRRRRAPGPYIDATAVKIGAPSSLISARERERTIEKVGGGFRGRRRLFCPRNARGNEVICVWEKMSRAFVFHMVSEWNVSAWHCTEGHFSVKLTEYFDEVECLMGSTTNT